MLHTCPNCGKGFTPSKKYMKGQIPKYCSRRCASYGLAKSRKESKR
jgi:hypothetical protein